MLVNYSFIYLFLIAAGAVSRGPEFIKKIKQKSVCNNAINARIVRAWATAINPELDLIRKNAGKSFSLSLFLCTACLAIFVEPEVDKTLSTKSNCHHKHWWFIRCPASSLDFI